MDRLWLLPLFFIFAAAVVAFFMTFPSGPYEPPGDD